eukprot:TRINITY_DN26188_c0_g9_i1.p1 TRINITY_DN26188_c0_g9~~TRINITY_DN26188_c0_g9_i1.p1  ORF type:complete len:349 (-),score=72.24 TRINITY_DN26188_c0_g9_i1:138-1184(-)
MAEAQKHGTASKARPKAGGSGVGGMAASLVELFARGAKRPRADDLIVLSDSGDDDADESTAMDHPKAAAEQMSSSEVLANDDESVERGVERELPCASVENSNDAAALADNCVSSMIPSEVTAASDTARDNDTTRELESGTAEEEHRHSAAVDDLFDQFRFSLPATPMQASRIASAPVQSSPSSLIVGRTTKAAKRERKNAEEPEDFSKLSEEERSRIVAKWRGLVGDSSDPEAIRLQLLVAAILHPKAPEARVQNCMTKLRDWGAADGGSSFLKRLAESTPDEVEKVILGLHWSRTKSVRLTAAAVMLSERCDGRVPCRREDLLSIPGIGPKLAGLLEFVIGAIAPSD